MVSPQRLKLKLLLSAALLAFSATPAIGAESYPSKMVKLVVPHPPAGSGDIVARVLSERLTNMWNVPVVVENKPGAAAMIGADAVAKAEPDGHTLLVVPSNLQTINPVIYKSMPFDAATAFRSVTLIGTTPFALVTGPSLNVNSVKELVELAKSRPNNLTYASSGVGSVQHLATEQFKATTGVSIMHVPYKGGAPSMVDLLAGRVDVYFGAATAVLPHVRTGKLKALATTGPNRTNLMPDLPTMIEAGIKGYVNEPWIGLVAPAGTPDDVIARINRDVRTVVNSPDVVAHLFEQGVDAAPGSPEDLDARIKRERAQWTKLVADTGIQAE